jgi:alpha-ketoglutarate-dependent taurine dioxygenase
MMTEDELFQTVLQKGWAVFPNLAMDADNASLLALGKRLGKISMQGSFVESPNFEEHGVNRVESMDVPMLDGAGNEVFSTNAKDFPLHTDDTFSATPCRFVLMHCWQADRSGGGVSWLAHIDEIMAIMPPDLLQRLERSLYTAPFGYTSVLKKAEQGHWRVQFNQTNMKAFARLRFQMSHLDAQKWNDLKAFEALAMQCLHHIALNTGDCIVVDNHRALHGRSAFDAGSGRLLKRLRVLQ